MEPRTLARRMNELAAFLGTRDVPRLSQAALEARLGSPRADVMALFGGSILAGGDVLAEAMRADVAERYVIVGGAGHTTETFRRRARELCPDLDFPDDAPEADVFAAYLEARHGLRADLLERRSTNCGNNITYLLDLLHGNGIWPRSAILSQDATMQRRMAAKLEREAPDIAPVSFATYSVEVVAQEGASLGVGYADAPLGMWDVERYLALLMGEVPRLADDEHGYGPRGAGHLAHVDIPRSARDAFEELRGAYPQAVRTANPRFAS
ncbi:MAG: YdcF family protein [Atopobiaceae bacterium]|nr:YdcF family protein [Atopobiaceae bacterium]